MNELSSTAIPNNQPSARGARQSDGQRGGQLSGQQAEREGRVEDVPKAMMSVSQV